MLVRIGWEDKEIDQTVTSFFEGELEEITIRREEGSITIPKEKISTVFLIKKIKKLSY